MKTRTKIIIGLILANAIPCGLAWLMGYNFNHRGDAAFSLGMCCLLASGSSLLFTMDAFR